MGIVLFDQDDFPVAPPALQALLEADRLCDVAIALKPHKADHAVLGCKAGVDLITMLRDAALEAVGDADVQRPVL